MDVNLLGNSEDSLHRGIYTLQNMELEFGYICLYIRTFRRLLKNRYYITEHSARVWYGNTRRKIKAKEFLGKYQIFFFGLQLPRSHTG